MSHSTISTNGWSSETSADEAVGRLVAAVTQAFLTVVPTVCIKALNAKLHPICHLLALLGARHILHIGRIRVKQCKFPVWFYENLKYYKKKTNYF